MDRIRAALPAFFSANGAVLTLFIGALALGERVQRLVIENVALSVIVLILIEILIVAVLFYVNRDQSTERYFRSEDEIVSVDEWVIRFETLDDFAGSERVYLEWFSDSLSVEDEEYCRIISRGKFSRVIEVRETDGPHRGHTIVGFYSIWPISRETFDRLASGELLEREFTSQMVLDPSDPEASILYVTEICVSKRAWSSARVPLLSDMATYVAHLLRENEHIKYVAAWPFTKQGALIVLRARMRRVKDKWRCKYYWVKRETILAILPKRPFKARYKF